MRLDYKIIDTDYDYYDDSYSVCLYWLKIWYR